jgi:hypothetical protein
MESACSGSGQLVNKGWLNAEILGSARKTPLTPAWRTAPGRRKILVVEQCNNIGELLMLYGDETPSIGTGSSPVAATITDHVTSFRVLHIFASF